MSRNQLVLRVSAPCPKQTVSAFMPGVGWGGRLLPVQAWEGESPPGHQPQGMHIAEAHSLNINSLLDWQP